MLFRARVGLAFGALIGFASSVALKGDEPKAPPSTTQQSLGQEAPGQKSPGSEAPSKPDEKPAAVETTPEEAAKNKEQDAEYYELYREFADTLDQVERNYVLPVSRRELMEAAIRGMLDKLDPYSNYIAPEELDQFKVAVDNQFGGIGIQVDLTPDGRLVVISPLVGSPAYRAGMQAGDWIVSVGGESIDGGAADEPSRRLKLDEITRRMKGPPGSTVVVGVARAGEPDRREFTLTREIIQLDTVMGERRDEQDRWDFMYDHERRIGYIRVTGFGRETADHLRHALIELQKADMQGLILDLRFNPGGLLTTAVEVSDLFITQGRIVSTAGRNSPEHVFDAHEPGTFGGFPMAVLVNHYSASASEIVSACLQDHHRAVIVGERTWGKGSVQNVIELHNGKSALKLTTAGYLRPNGHNINRLPNAKETDEWGVMPDPGYEIALTIPETREMIENRRQKDILRVNHFQAPKSADPAAQDAEKSAGAAPSENPPKDTNSTSENPAAEGAPEASKANPATEASGDTEGAKKPGEKPAAAPPYVDRQMQKALDYVIAEIAKPKP